MFPVPLKGLNDDYSQTPSGTRVRGNRPWIRSVGKWLTKRKTVSAKTKESARQKLKKLLNDQERLQAESLPPIDETVMVVSQLLDWWHKAIVATRRETNAINLLAMIRETSMPYRSLSIHSTSPPNAAFVYSIRPSSSTVAIPFSVTRIGTDVYPSL
jgi:hypothetical protein